MTKRRDDEDGAVITTPLVHGLYRTRERFVVTKPDGRKTDGLFSRAGVPQGTMVWIQAAPAHGAYAASQTYAASQAEVCLPWYGSPWYGSGSIAYAWPTDDGHVTISGAARTMGAADWSRFVANLEPDASEDAWLDHTLGAGAYFEGVYGRVLLELLESGAVSREVIEAAAKRLDARDEGEP